MIPTPDTIDSLLIALRDVARQELLSRFEGRLAVTRKADGSLVTSADHAVDERMRAVLAARFPGIPVLSEEQTREHQQEVLNGDGPFWLLDPLDGTTNFTGGLPFFAVSLALVDDTGVLFGATCDPVRDELFSATRSTGLRLNGEPIPRRLRENTELRECTALIDYKRLHPKLAGALVENPPYRSQRNLGACALEWAWLAAGRADLYLHGGQALWDSAAGGLMLAEAGGKASDLERGPVFRRTLEKPSAVAARTPALYENWLRWLDQRR
ncbi:Inositol-1-monophosphatase [Thioalkalivibrio nitratireducens DSM 14787]|uniref:Inositol-1-monophosphatase n=1 Tax=Thioalkalivibrio nitratireducens (strain DSM 14787 / UNIQEM 213 / ALEN2) TaxID=1255043 RepID=L0DSJ6_THIND|nr:inositol monophosphatase family protein [Thioalkalivibrio nitratireducens]AGA31962.1 Inositol-1-monophosphatase [Thioalkalivibrio nitratireducens DSM 14787]